MCDFYVQISTQKKKKILERNLLMVICICVWTVSVSNACLPILSFFFLVTAATLRANSLTLRMIGFCFTCHGSWRSEARVSLSVVVCATGDVTGSLDHSDPAYYSLQTICFYTSLHSWTCRSWNEVFFFSCLVSFNTSLKTVGFKYLVFECCVDCVGGKKEGQKANSTSATMALLQCKHLLLRDLSQLYIYDQNLSNPEYSSLQHHTTA